MGIRAFVNWPEAPLTESLVRRALGRLSLQAEITSTLSSGSDPTVQTLQWATYDAIDHEMSLQNPKNTPSSSFTIRKALIRKHFLSRCILAYTTKHPESPLLQFVPRTWDIEISYADELDELWCDDLWDLAEELDSYSEKGSDKWWILKPGMSDRGMGIRLFNSKETLKRIFENFEEEDDQSCGYEPADFGGDTGVVTSQLRHFVIQEYLHMPLLLDPAQALISPNKDGPHESGLKGRKFHLRAYCVVSGALTVYLYPQVLALFSSEPYEKPTPVSESPENLDLRPHLTNTCLQGDEGEANVRLLHELIGCCILSADDIDGGSITEQDITSLLDQMSAALSETFKAALQMPVHFQPLPNAFELYGVDFLVGHRPASGSSGRFEVKLLEFNSEPAIEMTGLRLRWILEDLFELIGKTCIEPFFSSDGNISAGRSNTCALRKCLEVKLYG